MNSKMLAIAGVALGAAIVGAQAKPDPRVGLKPGLFDAGEAAWNMERISGLSKPQGFFDPKAPGGNPSPPERDPNAPPDPNRPPRDPDAPPPFDPVASNRLELHQLRSRVPGHARLRRQLSRREYLRCRAARTSEAAGVDRLPGRTRRRVGARQPALHVGRADARTPRLRHAGCADAGQRRALPRHPHLRHHRSQQTRQVAAIQTCRGSHTHTVVPDPNDPTNLYLYGSGTSSVRSGEELAGCSGLKPGEDPNTALFSIDVIKVPLAHPEQAAIVNRPRVFADAKSGNIASLWGGGDHGPGTQRTSETNQCHDITVLSGNRPRRRRLFGQRDSARHPRSRAPGATRRCQRQELRVLAFGDFQQRRDEK